MKNLRLTLAGLLAACCAFGASAADKNTLIFDVAVIPEATRQIEWLAYPSYLAVALENNGIVLPIAKNIIITNAKSFKVDDKFFVRYTGETGKTYSYTITVSLPAGSSFEVPVAIDASSATTTGKVRIAVTMPLGDYYPQDYVERVGLKFSGLADSAMQHTMVTYLEGIDAKLNSAPSMEGRAALIMLDAYNRLSRKTNSVDGEAQSAGAVSLSEEIALVSALFIVGAVAVVRLRKKQGR